MGRGVLFHSEGHPQNPKEQCVGEVLSCRSFQYESILLSAFVTFPLFPFFGQFATVTYADDIRIFRLSFLKALLPTLYLIFFQDTEVALSPLLINFFCPCFPALYKFLWHQGLGLNKLIPHFQCVSVTLSWQPRSLKYFDTRTEQIQRKFPCSLPRTLPPGSQLEWPVSVGNKAVPKPLHPSVVFCSKDASLWYFSEIPVSTHCVGVSPSCN